MARTGGPATDRRIDVAVGVWAVLWLVLGGWTGAEVWRLSHLTNTVEDSGFAIAQAGEALQSLDPVPIYGDRAAELGTQARANGQAIVRDARDARGTFKRLAVLLGLAIALVPTVPAVMIRRVVRRTALRPD